MAINLLPADVVDRIGWLLVHSVWQFTLVALMLALLLKGTRRAPGSARYAAALAAWGVMLIAPVVTWRLLPASSVTDRATANSSAGVVPAVDAAERPHPSSADTEVIRRNSQEVPKLFRPPDVTMAAAPESTKPPATVTVPPERAVPWQKALAAAITPWLDELVLLWCAGVLVFAARAARGWYVVRCMLRRDVSDVPDELLVLLGRVAQRMGLGRHVRVLQSGRVDVPLVAGWLRPVILLPACVVTGFSPVQMEAVFAHEVSHILRSDYVINLLQTLTETLFFYHPAVWWVSGVLRREREHCCDELAAQALGSRADYGRALLALEELRGAAPGLALGVKSGSLLERIRRLAASESPSRLSAGGAIAVTVLAAFVVGAGVWAAALANAEPKNSAPAAADDAARADRRRPFIVQGIATDEARQPLAGVEVVAHAGLGTLRATGRAVTDESGRYTLRFGGGILFVNEETAPLGIGVQAATISPRMAGWYEVNLHQQGNLAIADHELSEEERKAWHSYQHVLLPEKPYELNFVLAKGATIEGRLVNEFGRPIADERISLDGDDLPPSSSVLASFETNAKGEFQFEGVPLNRDWHFAVRVHGTRQELSTEPFRFEEPELRRYELTLTSFRNENGGVEFRLEQKLTETVALADPTSQFTAAPDGDPHPTSGDKAEPKQPDVPHTEIRGVVVDESGAPVPGIEVDTQYVGRQGRRRASTLSGKDGRFTLSGPTERLGVAGIVGISSDRERMAFFALPWDVDKQSPPEVTLTLKPAERVDVRVVDKEDRPVEGARATVQLAGTYNLTSVTDAGGRAVFRLPADADVRSLHAWKGGLGLDYRVYWDPQRYSNGEPQQEPDFSQPVTLSLTGIKPLTVRLIDADTEQPISDVPVYVWLIKKETERDDLNVSFFTDELSVRTDARGQATFDWIPEWDTRETLQVWHSSHDYDRQRGVYKPAEGEGTLVMRLHRLVPIRGRVTFPDGRPAPGIRLQVSGEGYSLDGFRTNVTTDSEGRYEVRAAPNQVYLIIIDDPKWAAPPATGFALLPGQPKENVDFVLQPAVRIFGRVTLGPDRQPVPGQRISSCQYGADLNNMPDSGIAKPPDNNRWVQPLCFRHATTDEDGRYELFVGPGQYDLRGPTQNEVQKFEITTETEREFNFHMERPAEGPLTGLVVTGDPPQPVSGATVHGIYRNALAGRRILTTTDANGRFQVTRELHRTVLHAVSDSGDLAGVVEIGPDETSVTIAVQPCASASGRLVDEATNEPVPNAELQYGVNVHIGDDTAPFLVSFGGSATTDDEGRFRLDRLIVGQKYDVSVVTARDSEGRGRSWRRVTLVTPDTPGASIELGDVVRKPEPPPYKPPTLEERIASAFHKSDDAATRYRNNLRDIRIGHLRQLMILADPDAEATRQLFELRYEDQDVRRATDDYWLLPLPLAGDKADDTRAFAAGKAIEISEGQAPLLIVIDEEEQQVARASAADLSTDGTIDKQKVLDFLKAHVPEQLDAQVLFDEALARAKAENKRVFIQESATWCGPCWMLSRFIDRHRALLEQDYIFVKLDHRWPHSREIAEKFRGEPRGIPWFAILDADQNMLTNSNGPDGSIGYPSKSEPDGIKHFLGMLRDSRIRLTDADLETLRAALEE